MRPFSEPVGASYPCASLFVAVFLAAAIEANPHRVQLARPLLFKAHLRHHEDFGGVSAFQLAANMGTSVEMIELLRQKTNAGSKNGNGGDEVQGTVMVGRSYAIRSLPSAICMRIIPSEGPVNILNFAANAHWYARDRPRTAP